MLRDNMLFIPATVTIGLALTSHNATVTTGAAFAGVAETGGVSGNWQIAEIGLEQPEGNIPESLYVAVEDTAGNVAVAMNLDDAAATAVTGPDGTAVLSWQVFDSSDHYVVVYREAVDLPETGVGFEITIDHPDPVADLAPHRLDRALQDGVELRALVVARALEQVDRELDRRERVLDVVGHLARQLYDFGHIVLSPSSAPTPRTAPTSAASSRRATLWRFT